MNYLTPNEALDLKVLASIKSGKVTFQAICVDTVQNNFSRKVDASLQRMRRKGKIAYVLGAWTVL